MSGQKQKLSGPGANDEVADLHIPAGCPLCGGGLEVRSTPGSTMAYCRTCLCISRPKLAVGVRGVAVMHKAAAA